MSLYNKLTFPVLPNHKVTGDYTASKLETKTSKFDPEWDQARQDPRVELVISKRKLHLTEVLLIEKRIWANEKRKDLDRQWKELEEKESNLRNNFITFNTFVKENFEKRVRANAQTEDEIKLRKERIESIENLRQKYDNLKLIKELMDKKLKEHMIYENFLEQIVRQCDEYSNIQNIINHYETLLEAKIQLANKQEQVLEQLENARSKMMKITEENTFSIMGLNNQITSLNKRYKLANENVLFWENIVAQIARRGFERLNEINEIKSATWHIYLLMCRRKNVEAVFNEDQFEEQTVFIKRTLLEIKRVNNVFKKQNKTNKKSLKAHVSMKS